jgi:AraC family transcriptional regulator of adaptative response / DNA-3-methyladenine glycosylase II
MLDTVECDRARLARDRSYDGRFYTGVRTTGVYCRPVCPVRPARSRNVEFFQSAAAAEAAGFHPCLRCRPETAPFSAAWNGSRSTVARGLRLIAEGALAAGFTSLRRCNAVFAEVYSRPPSLLRKAA